MPRARRNMIGSTKSGAPRASARPTSGATLSSSNSSEPGSGDAMTQRDKTQRDDYVEQTCARLRDLLEETRSLDRRAFIAAFSRAMAGSALMSVFAGAM